VKKGNMTVTISGVSEGDKTISGTKTFKVKITPKQLLTSLLPSAAWA